MVSARKYRPDSFDSIVGQEALTATLKTAIVSDKSAHAYLFCGPRGVGKTTAARVFAKTINCSNRDREGEACNECESCVSFNEQRSMSIYELDAASNNSVDDIRLLIEQVQVPPQIGNRKIYIIDEVHMLSQAAFNAFLKTLEEPPEYVVFILATTEKHKILPTILSRCQIYDFKRITVASIAKHLASVAAQEHIEADPEALAVIAEKADGGMRDALSMFDRIANFSEGKVTYHTVIESLNILDYEYYFRFFGAFIQGDFKRVLLILNELLDKGFDGEMITNGMASFVRDLLMAHAPETLPLLEKPVEIAARYVSFAAECPISFLFKALSLLNDCDKQYKFSNNKRLLVELTLMQISALYSSELRGSGEAPKNPQPAVAPASSEETKANPIQETPKDIKEPVRASSPSPAETPTSSSAEISKSNTPLNIAQPTTVTTKRLTRKSKMIRLDSANDEPVAEEDDTEESVKRRNAFSGERLQRCWLEYAATMIPEQVQQRIAMHDSLPEIVDAELSTIKIVVDSLFVKEIIEADKELVPFLREQLANSDVSLHIDVCEKTVDSLPHAVEDKLAALKKENDLLSSFCKSLDLMAR